MASRANMVRREVLEMKRPTASGVPNGDHEASKERTSLPLTTYQAHHPQHETFERYPSLNHPKYEPLTDSIEELDRINKYSVERETFFFNTQACLLSIVPQYLIKSARWKR